VPFTAHVVFDVDARSADCARAAKTFAIPYQATGVRPPYVTHATADGAAYGQYRTQLVIWSGGRDLSGGTDEKAIIYRPAVTGASTTAAVQVVSLSGNDSPVSKSGLAIANDLSAPQKGGYAVLTMSAQYGVEFMTDSDGDGHLDTWAGGGLSAHPVWLRLVRSGPTYTAYTGSDGVAWQQLATATVPSAGPGVDVGIVATAGNLNFPGTTIQAIFDHFTVEAS
jgi:hypothetical protein